MAITIKKRRLPLHGPGNPFLGHMFYDGEPLWRAWFSENRKSPYYQVFPGKALVDGEWLWQLRDDANRTVVLLNAESYTYRSSYDFNILSIYE